MLYAYAMDDGCLAVMTIRRCFRVYSPLDDAPKTTSRWRRMGSAMRKMTEGGALMFFDRRLAGMGYASGIEGGGLQRLLPVLIFLVQSGHNSGRELLLGQRRLGRSYLGRQH